MTVMAEMEAMKKLADEILGKLTEGIKDVPRYEVTVFYTHNENLRHMSYKDLTLGDISTLPEVLSGDVESMNVRKMRKLLQE
tara:strand:+ start:628 stop:873 length:246 start_codon:yes stop_codon:yes gene_type:complete